MITKELENRRENKLIKTMCPIVPKRNNQGNVFTKIKTET